MAKKSKTSSFRGKVSRDAKRQQSAGSSYGHLILPKGISVFSPEPGSRIKLDFLPYLVTDKNHPDRDVEGSVAIEGTQWYKRPYKLHRNVGSSQDSAVCPTSIGKKCPICEYRVTRQKEGADKDETDGLRASQRNLYLVIPLGNKKFEEKVHLFDISQYNFQNLLNDELEEDGDREIFPDLDEGLTLKVRFDSKTIGNSKPFAEASRIDFYDRESAYEESILDTIPSLDKVLKIMTYEELDAKFFERDVEDKDEDDEPSKPMRKRKPVDEDDDDVPEQKPMRKSKPVPVEDEDDDDVPEQKPVRKPKPAPVEEPDEDEPDEDEPTPPVRTRKPVKEEPPAPPVRRPAKPAAPTGGKDRCPHGHRFGTDAEQFDDCDTCKSWDACIEAKEAK